MNVLDVATYVCVLITITCWPTLMILQRGGRRLGEQTVLVLAFTPFGSALVAVALIVARFVGGTCA